MEEQHNTTCVEDVKDSSPETNQHVEFTENTNLENPEFVAPDGGWGWVVVFASFMIHVVTDGVVYSLGELFGEFLSRFESSNGATSTIISTLVGMTLCSGPIAGAFVNKYGCRPVTIAGSIISTCFIFCSVYANSISMLVLTIGIGTGFGFGLIYLPAIICVTCYFEKYRSVATGIAVCGSGFGTVIFAPMFKFLLAHVGIEGTFVVISMLVLTCVFYGLLFRPVMMPTGMIGVEDNLNSVQMVANISDSENNYPETVPLTIVTTPSPNRHRKSLIELDDMTAEATAEVERDNNSGIGGLTVQSNGHIGGGNRAIYHNNNSSSVIKNSLTASQCRLNSNGGVYNSTLSLKSTNSGVMYRKDVFLYGSSRELTASNKFMYSTQKIPQLNNSDFKKKESSCCPHSDEFRNTLSEMMDFSIIKDPVFIVFAASNFFTSIGYNIPYIFVPIQATDKRMDNYLSGFLLSAVGIGNTLGRVILGYICDKPQVNRLYVYNTCLTLCGIVTVSSIFCRDVYTFGAFCALYGFTTGAYVSLTSVVTADLLGLEKLTNAFGMILLFQGIASFIGPPIAGWLCDYYQQHHDPAFFIAGIAITISGLMLYMLTSLTNCLERCKKQKLTVNRCKNKIYKGGDATLANPV